MTEAEDIARRSRRLAAWLEEYRALSGDIMARVDLQQKNSHLNLTVVSAFTGYLVKSWQDLGFAAVAESELAILFVVVPLMSNMFVWRHIDHDANIIDKATYIEEVVRPAVVDCTGDQNAMSFEAFLNRTRRIRPTSIFMGVLGNEHILIFGFLLLYLLSGWNLFSNYPARGGGAQALFDVLLFASSGFMIASIVMSVLTLVRYRRLAVEVTSQVITQETRASREDDSPESRVRLAASAATESSTHLQSDPAREPITSPEVDPH